MSDTANSIEELSQQLRAAVGRVYRRFRALRASDELGESATAVLNRIRKAGPQTLTALSEEARVTPSSMSQTVNRLAAGGYLVRAADPSDGRRVLFQLTEQGRVIDGMSVARGRAWFDGELTRATAEERALLSRAAVILLRIADAPAPDASPPEPTPTLE